MEITEVRIKLMEESEDRLRAFCSITINNCFVVRDLKIIEGSSGPFVAMPSRKLTERCGKCGYKNHLRSNYCNQCGIRLKGARGGGGGDSESNSNKLYADIAHPINQGCRDIIQTAVVREYAAELERAKLPGYKSRYDDEYVESMKPETTLNGSETIDQANIDTSLKGPEGTSLRVDPPKSDNPASSTPHFDDQKDQASREKSNNTDEFGRGIL